MIGTGSNVVLEVMCPKFPKVEDIKTEGKLTKLV